jgi:thioredoxin 1
MSSSKLPEVNDDNFQAEVLDSPLPVLVEFTADWCGPCRAIEPALVSLAARGAGKLKVAQLDVERSHELAQQFRVMSMPTMIVFRNGRPVGQLVGAHAGKLQALAEPFLT